MPLGEQVHRAEQSGQQAGPFLQRRKLCRAVIEILMRGKHIDGDDHVQLITLAQQSHRQRIGSTSIGVAMPIQFDRSADARDSRTGMNGSCDRTFFKNVPLQRVQIGRDSQKRNLKVCKVAISQGLLQMATNFVTTNETRRGGKGKIQETRECFAIGDFFSQLLQSRTMQACGPDSSHISAHAGACDGSDRDVILLQHLNDTDVGKPPSTTCGKYDSQFRN